MSINVRPGQLLRIPKRLLSQAAKAKLADLPIDFPIVVFNPIQTGGEKIIAVVTAVSNGDTTRAIAPGHGTFSLSRPFIERGIATRLGAEDWRTVAAEYRRRGNLAQAQKYENRASLQQQPRVGAFPIAVIMALQTQLRNAVASGATQEAERLRGIMRMYGIPLEGNVQVDAVLSTPGPKRIPTSGRSLFIYPAAKNGLAKTGDIRLGDVVRLPYRAGDVVANDIRVSSVNGNAVQGVIGAVVHKDGRVEMWWNDQARMKTSAQFPTNAQKASAIYVWRNNQQIA